MFQIAICDDNIEIGTELERIIKEYRQETHKEIYVTKYISADSLYEELENGQQYDLLFLDIVFDKEVRSGLEIARQIREDLGNEYIHIVYVSAQDDCYEAAFASRPIHFLHKPFRVEEVKKDIEVAMLRSNMCGEEFVYQTGRQMRKVYMKDILYFESKNHQIVLHMVQGGSDVYYDKIAALRKKLDDKRFLQIHKSYIISAAHVQQWYSDKVVMQNGDTLSISRGRRKVVQEYLMNYGGSEL